MANNHRLMQVEPMLTPCTLTAWRTVGFIVMAWLCTGCVTFPRNPVPIDVATLPTLPGMPEAIRSSGLSANPALQSDFATAMVQGGGRTACDHRDNKQPVFCVLIVSGGGELGAYGAGVINGWTQNGTRPTFKFVTGVSTGGLIAPFAFLGPAWDEQLKDAFLTIRSSRDVLRRRGLFRAVRNDSITDTAPLAEHIAKFVTQEMVEAIKAEHNKGRRLYIGTTNMDTQAFTIWNIGEIARVDGPQALVLIRQILLASASIPILMPPVMIEVESNGQRYDEMHSDGGVQAQFFVPLMVIDLPKAIAQANAEGFPHTPTPRMFIIRNSKFQSKQPAVERNLLKIGARAVSSMTQAMGRSDLNQIYAMTRSRGTDFHYTEVPADFDWHGKSQFDGPEMHRLYDIGFKRAVSGDLWSSRPPGVFAENIE